MRYEIIKNTSNSCVGANGFAICKDKQILPGWFETKDAAQKHLATLNDEQEAEENLTKEQWWQSLDQDEEYINQVTDQEWPYK